VKIAIQATEFSPLTPTRIGNVYHIRGGRGLRDGHLQVLIAITEGRPPYQGEAALFLVITKDGKPIGVNSYGMHVLEDWCPIAFVEGLEEMELTMRSI
jgi:hypothetical protein